jgi:hypothetical protein
MALSTPATRISDNKAVAVKKKTKQQVNKYTSSTATNKKTSEETMQSVGMHQSSHYGRSMYYSWRKSEGEAMQSQGMYQWEYKGRCLYHPWREEEILQL